MKIGTLRARSRLSFEAISRYIRSFVMGYLSVERGDFPIVRVVKHGSVSDERFRAFWDELDELLRGPRYAIIVDLRTAAIPPASQRAEVARRWKRNEAAAAKVCVACAFIFESALWRGVWRAIGWVHPPPHPVGYFGTPAEAEAYARSKLAAAGIRLSHEPETHEPVSAPMPAHPQEQAVAREGRRSRKIGRGEARDNPTARGAFTRSAATDQWPGNLIGYRLADRYLVVRLIARGGMGAVFEVEDEAGQRAAAKLIDNARLQDGAALRRFIREARVATGIDSSHVLAVRGAHRDERLRAPFIVMELLQGIDLKTLLQARGALAAPEIVRVFVQAARGIAAAHSRGIIHRDIKPSNIFLHVDESTGLLETKICDFGLAKYVASWDPSDSHDVTRTGGIVGSPMYMSPEQAMNAKHIDQRADVWSFCATFYEALSGRKLWREPSSLGEIIVAMCTRSPPLLHNIAPWVNRDLADIVARGLRSDPRERWSSMEALIAALEPHAGSTQALRLRDLRAAPSTSSNARDGSRRPSPQPVQLSASRGSVSQGARPELAVLEDHDKQ